jgi:hypothetical protein
VAFEPPIGRIGIFKRTVLGLYANATANGGSRSLCVGFAM